MSLSRLRQTRFKVGFSCPSRVTHPAKRKVDFKIVHCAIMYYLTFLLLDDVHSAYEDAYAKMARRFVFGVLSKEERISA